MVRKELYFSSAAGSIAPVKNKHEFFFFSHDLFEFGLTHLLLIHTQCGLGD
jgi:hypothetical protein